MLSWRFIRFFRYLNFDTFKQIVAHIGEQRLPGLSAEIAYNAMLALFPAILAILTAIGLLETSQDTFQGLATRLGEVAPDEVLVLIRNFIREITTTRNQGLFSLSFIAALWISSAATSSAMAALDQIYRIPRSQRRPFWKAKLVSLVLTVGTILLLILASFLVFLSDLLVRLVAGQSGSLGGAVLSIWRLFSWPLALSIVAIAFAFIYRHGPSRWSQGTPIMPGAIVGALLWAMLSGLFRLYVSHFGNYNQVYGAVGAVIILLLWLQLSSLVLLIGAQLNATVGQVIRHRKTKILSTGPLDATQNPCPDGKQN